MFFLVFTSIALIGFGQNTQADKQIKLGISVSAGQNNFTDFYEWRDFLCFEGCGVTGYEAGYSYTIGLTGSFSLNEKLELISGLEYAQKNYYEEGFDFFNTYRIERNLKYLQVPVLARYKFYSTDSKKVQAFVDLGVNVLVNVNTDKEEFTFEETLRDVGISAQTGLGLAINFEKFTLAVGPQFSYAVTNLGAKGHTDGPDNNKLRPYEIGLGIRILR